MKEISLTRGYVAMVDDEDYELLAQFHWIANVDEYTVYATRRLENGKRQKMHRLLMGLSDPNIFVDHKDHNGLNNQRSNLRIATRQQNRANSRQTAKIRGVLQCKNGTFRARIRLAGHLYHLGYFKSAKEAARTYNAAALENFGEFAALNQLEKING